MGRITVFAIAVLAFLASGCAGDPYTKPRNPKNPNWWKHRNSSLIFPSPPGSNAEEKTIEGEESNTESRKVRYMEAVKQPDGTYKMEWRSEIIEEKE